MTRPTPTHDPRQYDTQFEFVARLGAGVVDLADIRPGERLLDLGCGTGALLPTFIERGAIVSGIDADPKMIEVARSVAPDADLRVADGQDFTVEEPYDIVFSNAALHWMPNAAGVARSVHAALRPRGRFVAEMGGARNVATIVDAVHAEGAARGVDVESPWYYPTVAEQAAVLEAAGFRVALMEHFERITPLHGEDGVADWLQMFGGHALANFPAETHDEVRLAVQERTRSTLRREAGWVADYWRLRFVAIAD